MLTAYAVSGAQLLPGAPLETAVWIDLCQPEAAEVAAVTALGVAVPTLADMEEIELSNRLYHEGDTHVMTVVLTGQTEGEARISAPVSFLLSPARLVTVRHHRPRSFETFAPRADRSAAGTGSPAAIFLGLTEEITGRLADHLEEIGRGLDTVSATIYAADPARRTQERLQVSLQRVGREGEMLSRLRLSLLTLARAIGFVQPLPALRPLADVAATQTRDLQALEVHADFLGARLALTSDATLGMIDLAQNATVRIVSVVSVLFLPPTLIASIYGMNFAVMPELAQTWGYPAALIMMLASAALSWAFFKWKKWL
ncbi:MAG TPA: CorA family divalent cation transporter [Gemmobacter sp.]|nr:CorA family divalent cation transporter [Gemmobacter sp.]